VPEQPDARRALGFSPHCGIGVARTACDEQNRVWYPGDQAPERINRRLHALLPI
jgi:hypothetical protein